MDLFYQPIREEFRKNFSEALNPYSYQIKFRFFIQLFQLIKSNVYEPSEEFLVETCLEMLIHRSDDLMENSELDKKEEESNENSWNIYLTLTGKPKNREFFNFYVIRFIEKNRRLKKNETEVLVKMDYLHALVCWTKSDLNGAKNFIRRSFDRLKVCVGLVSFVDWLHFSSFNSVIFNRVIKLKKISEKWKSLLRYKLKKLQIVTCQRVF